MKSKLLLSAVVAALPFCLLSCKKEIDPPKPGDKISVELTVRSAPYYVSGTETNDTRTSLDNVWILEFDADGNNVLAAKINTMELNKAFTQEVIAGTGMKLVVVANAGSASFTEGGMTYTQFAEMGYEGAMATAADIPMTGSGTATIDKEKQVIAAITVSRIASVVSFKFAAGGDHEMSTFQLRNVPAKVYYLSQGDNSAWTADKFTDMASVAADGEEHTCIVGENLQGSVSGITDAKDKETEKLAMYVEVMASNEGTEATTESVFKYFFGENATTSFDVARNKEYTADVTIDFDDESDERISQTTTPVTQQAGAANSYILAPDKAAYLGIPVSRVNEFWNTDEGGNTKANVISDGGNGGGVTAWKARVMWTDTDESIIDIVTDSGTSADDYIAIAAKGGEGNAVVGIFDATAGEPAADALPLWSWHIWVTAYNPGGGLNGDIPDITANPGKAEVEGGKIFRVKGLPAAADSSNDTPAMMDRNLGALSADPADGVKTIGAFYQWGRKDPFIMPQGTAAPKDFTPAVTAGAKSKEYAVQNPATFVTGTYVWLDEDEDGLWQSTNALQPEKTIYDPCPEGWRVPTLHSFLGGDKEGNMKASAKEVNGLFSGTVLYGDAAGLDIYFPRMGYLGGSSGAVTNFDNTSCYWTVKWYSANNSKNTIIYNPDIVDEYGEFGPPYAIMAEQNGSKSAGMSVRCTRE